MNAPHTGFTQILKRMRLEPHGTSARGSVSVPDDWTQGRALFGGLVAALAARAAEHLAPSERALRSLQTSFIGPLRPGRVDVEATLLRSGRAVTQVEARVLQEGRTRCAAFASFASDRSSALRIPAPQPPTLPDVSACTELPYLEGVTPTFTRHFMLRWGLGQFPFTGASEALVGGYCRLRDEPGDLTTADVIALVDAWPPPTLPLLETPAPGSSVTWMLDLVHPPVGVRDAWCSYRAEARVVANGYAHADAALWGPDGQLLALGRQLVAVFDG